MLEKVTAYWSRSPQPVVISLYGLLLLNLLGHLSLWVDELLQLMGTRTGTMADLHRAIAANVGGVPLGWLTQIASIHLFGYSVESARLPSALFSIGSCLLIGLIAKQLDLRNGTLAICIFASIPLQFRYALEARPYMQGIFCALLATLAFLHFLRRPVWQSACVYAAATILALYSMPLSFLIPLGLTVCRVGTPEKKQPLLLCTCLSASLAVLLFIPWYLYAQPFWQRALSESPRRFHLPLKTPVLIVQELSGAGFAGSIPLIILAAIGLTTTANQIFFRISICCISICTLGVLWLDESCGYFLAIRQFIFILPFLALLAAEGIGTLRLRNAKFAAAALILILGVYDYLWMVRPRQDWQIAASVIMREMDAETCIIKDQENGLAFLSFFYPGLAARECSPEHVYRRFVVIRPPSAPLHTLPSRFQRIHEEVVGEIPISFYSLSCCGGIRAPYLTNNRAAPAPGPPVDNTHESQRN